MTCSECFNTQSEGVHISALEHRRKIKFSIYVHQKLKYTKCEQCYRYYNQSRRVYMSALKHCRKMKFRRYLHLTLISKIFFVVTVE